LRERIISVAGELIDELGIKFTMSDLAARMAVSKHTLYEYFHSKEELISAIVDSFLLEVNQRHRKIIQDEKLTLADKIKSLTFIYPMEQISHISRLLSDLHHYYPEERAKVERYREEFWQLLVATIFREGVESNYFKSVNPAILQMLYNGITDQLLNNGFRFLPQNNITIQDALKAIQDIMLYGLVVEERRKAE